MTPEVKKWYKVRYGPCLLAARVDAIVENANPALSFLAETVYVAYVPEMRAWLRLSRSRFLRECDAPEISEAIMQARLANLRAEVHEQLARQEERRKNAPLRDRERGPDYGKINHQGSVIGVGDYSITRET